MRVYGLVRRRIVGLRVYGLVRRRIVGLRVYRSAVTGVLMMKGSGILTHLAGRLICAKIFV